MDDIYDHIREGDLSEFRPQATNARIHPARAIGMLEQSIGEVGWFGAIGVAADGESFDGSLRLETAATALPNARIKVVDHTGDEIVVARRIDIPSADTPIARKASVWANRISEVGEWDYPVLANWQAEGDIDLGDMWYPEELAAWEFEKEPTSRFDDDVDAPPIVNGGIPLAIVLSPSELKEWNILKETVGAKSDTELCIKLMRGEV